MERGIDGYIEITVTFAEEGKQWSALCQELGTAACGDTFEEAREALVDMIQLHLNTLEQIGERKNFFKKHHIVFHRHRPRPRRRRLSVPPDTIFERLTQPVPMAPAL